MVHREQKNVLIIRNTDQPAADQRSVLKIERGSCFRANKIVEFLLGIAMSTQIMLTQMKTHVFHRSNRLHRLTLDDSKTSAERFMADYNAVQRSPKCCVIKV